MHITRVCWWLCLVGRRQMNSINTTYRTSERSKRDGSHYPHSMLHTFILYNNLPILRCSCTHRQAGQPQGPDVDEERHRPTRQSLVWLRPNGRRRNGAAGAQVENGTGATTLRNQCTASGHVSYLVYTS